MINIQKIILYILIGFGVTSCSTPTTNEEAKTQSTDETIVSKGFIGQTFSNKSTDSFGQTKQVFSFEKNGIGTYHVAWTVSSTLHEDMGDMSWEINEGKIHVHYTYKSSDGITSSEEEVFIYNESSNSLISDNNNSIVFRCSPKITIHESNTSNEEEFNLGGSYTFGSDVEKGAVGSLEIYPISDESAYFFVSVCIGAPSYNLGDMFGLMTKSSGKGEFYSDGKDTYYNCKLKFKFFDNKVKITTEESSPCEFGGSGVSADYTYSLSDRNIPKTFIDNVGKTFSFDRTTLKSYYK